MDGESFVMEMRLFSKAGKLGVALNLSWSSMDSQSKHGQRLPLPPKGDRHDILTIN